MWEDIESEGLWILYAEAIVNKQLTGGNLERLAGVYVIRKGSR